MSKRLGAIAALTWLSACALPEVPAAGPPARRALLGDATPLPAVTALPACTPAPPTPTPGPSAPGTGDPMLIVSGMVLDAAGRPADGVVVRVKSLDPAVPYLATATTFGGSWVVNNLPAGALVAIEARGTDLATAPVLLVGQRGQHPQLTLRATPALAPLGPEVAPPRPSATP